MLLRVQRTKLVILKDGPAAGDQSIPTIVKYPSRGQAHCHVAVGHGSHGEDEFSAIGQPILVTMTLEGQFLGGGDANHQGCTCRVIGYRKVLNLSTLK